MTGGGESLEGPYRAVGYTKNSADGNTTHLSNLVVYFKEGKVTGNGHYGSGSNYNPAQRTQWKGTYGDGSVEWTEIYGDDTEYPFYYQGFYNQNSVWGTYRWSRNQAVGSFNFELTPC